MLPLGAPSISKYGSLVRPGAQIVALHVHLRLRLPIFFGAFGAWYSLCFSGQVTVSPQRGGGDCKGGGGVIECVLGSLGQDSYCPPTWSAPATPAQRTPGANFRPEL